MYDTRNGGVVNFQLDEALYEFTALEKLYISLDFTGFDDRLAHLQELTYLSIRSKLLQTLPSALYQFTTFDHFQSSVANAS